MKSGHLYTSSSRYITFYPTQELAIKSGADTHGLLQYVDTHRAAAEDTCIRFFDRHGVKINYIAPLSLFLAVKRTGQKMGIYEFWQILIGERTGWIILHTGSHYNYIVSASGDDK